MLVGDLICSDSFDVNCVVNVYQGIHDDGGMLLYNSEVYPYSPTTEVLGRKITYITISDDMKLIIECE